MKVQAPPEKGKANRAVVTQLAQWLELPAHAIYLKSGRPSPSKVVVIEGLDELEIQRRIDQITAKAHAHRQSNYLRSWTALGNDK